MWFSSDIKDDAHDPLISEEPPTPTSSPVSEHLVKRECFFYFNPPAIT